ncbi:MAG: winged helix-turn-helix domain-containing protein [Pseudoalteromonas sp.]|uniref:winged helix-turn-helix domain-containing protein n=1 Tax=Pseudoalteromonas sp. TaxID=53249 RepID=UPI003F960A67
MSIEQPFSVGICQVNVLENTLTCNGDERVLQPKFIELLGFLASRYPEIVTREELINNVWDGNHFVGEKALTNGIWHVRKAFKELDPDNDYIDTLRKTGYRLAQLPHYVSNDQYEAVPVNNGIFKRYWFLILAVTLALISAVITSMSLDNSPINKKSLSEHVETITSSPGRELFPTISKDNHYLAYSWRRLGSQRNLYLHDLLSPNKASIALTDNQAIEGRVVFSHDAQSIYYYQYQSSGECQLVEQVISSGKITKLAKCIESLSSDLDITNQGDKLVFLGPRSSADNGQQINNFAQLKIINLNDHSVTEVACQACNFYDESVAFSPTGEQLVVSRNLPTGHEELFILDIKTAKATQITNGFVDIRGVDWHPSKPMLVFSGIKQGQRHGYFYDLTTDKLTNADIEGLSFPEFASDGSLYFHQWQIDSALMRVAIGDDVASSPFPIMSSHFSSRFSDYSEVTKQLAYTSNESGFTELWRASLDGTERVQLTQLEGSIYNPVWSYDGRFIAFTLFKSGENGLYFYDTLQEQIKKVDTQLTYHGKPAWSHDNQSILISNGSNLFRIDLNNGQVTQALDSKAMYGYENTAGDIIFANQENTQLWIKPAGSMKEQLLVDNINLSNNFAWHFAQEDSTTTARIYYFNVKADDYRLSYYDIDKQIHHDAIRLPERAFSRSSGLTYIADKHWLVFTSYKSPQIDIKRIKAQYLPF